MKAVVGVLCSLGCFAASIGTVGRSAAVSGVFCFIGAVWMLAAIAEWRGVMEDD